MYYRNKVQPKNIESPFRPDEIFFSTTDLKGIILSGNSVFVRVSKFSKEELVGSPHNIVRHPDMPRIIFKLLWDYIKSGKPIVAYVKNMAKDGSYYWVLATVMPVKDDEGHTRKYLSIRIKPTTEYLDLVNRIYKQLLEEEKTGGMEASYKKLLEELKKYGYSDYDQFMADVLSKELESKKDLLKVDEIDDLDGKTEFDRIVVLTFDIAKKMDNIFDSIYNKISVFSNFSHLLREKSDNIFRLTDYIRLISLNSSVESFKLGSRGASFSVLSAEMRKNSEMGNKIIGEMKNITEKIMDRIESMIVLINISRLQVITITKFIKEILDELKSGEFDAQQKQEFQTNVEDLLQLLKTDSKEILTYSEEIMELLKDINEYMKRLKILVKRLEFLYLNGMVEAAHHTETSFSIIFTEVNKLVESTRNVLVSLHNPLFDVIQKNKELKKEFQEIEELVGKMYHHLSDITHQVVS